MDGARAAARRGAAGKIKTYCICGKVLYGNGAKTHLRTCEKNLHGAGWPLDQGMKDALMSEYCGNRYVYIVRHVELGLGRIYLERRAAGNRAELPWREYRDTVWQLADEAASQACPNGTDGK